MKKVRVSAKPEAGFYRAGIHWSFGGQEAEVDEATFRKIQAEPMLSVVVVGETVKAIDDMSLDELLEYAQGAGIDLASPVGVGHLYGRSAAPRRFMRRTTAALQAGGYPYYDVWRAKLLDTPGTALPEYRGAPFPGAAELMAAETPYLYLEDFVGVTKAELMKVKGVGKAVAENILEALTDLAQ